MLSLRSLSNSLLRLKPILLSSMSSIPTISPSTAKIGWIGTGVMGQSMASRLLSAGYSLTVFNRTPSKTRSLLAQGARLADSPLAVAQSSNIIFLTVGYPSDVRQAILHPSSGLLPGLAPGSFIVDMTTSDPTLAVEIQQSALKAACFSIDAPVSGGDRGAREGTLSIFAGGDEGAIGELSPLFACLGTVRYMGGAGKGQMAKLGNQVAVASTMVGMVEGMVYAHKCGLDVGRWLEAVSGGAAGSRLMESYGRRIVERDMAAGFYVHHFVKDLGICLKECERMGIGLPGLALAQQMYVSLVGCGEGGLGTQALILAVERMNNVCLKKGVE